MIHLVKSCFNCPFQYIERDYNSLGYDTLEICILASKSPKLDNYVIKCYDSYDETLLTEECPEWCPLINTDICIQMI